MKFGPRMLELERAEMLEGREAGPFHRPLAIEMAGH
jgi:hypothetical protein